MTPILPNNNNKEHILDDIESKNSYNANETWGDKMILKEHNTIRIYFHNIRNLTINDEWQAWTDVLEKMKSYNVDIFGFVEPNVNWTTTLNIKAAKIGRRVNNNQFILQTSTSEEYSSSQHKRGGTILCTTNKIVGRVASRSSDPKGLGRWTTTSITGRNHKMLHIICLYRVSQEQSKGDNTSFMQQIRLLKQQNIRNPNPRQQVLDDLDTLLKQVNKEKDDVIIMMDANSDLQDGALTKILHKHKLYDALGSKHGHNQPSTYARGVRTIDYIFCSETIINAIVKGGILPYNELIPSDHRGLFIDIDTNIALKGSIHEADKSNTTFFTTKHKKKCKQYREQVTKEIQQYSMMERLDEIVNKFKQGYLDEEGYQEWDKDMTNIMTETAKKFKTNNNIWWSPDLHHAHLGVKYWKLRITQKQINVDMSTQLKKVEDEIPSDFDLYYGNNTKSLYGYLRSAQKHLLQTKKNSKQLRKEHHKKLIIESIETNNKKLNKRVKAIMYAEETSRMYATLRHYLHPHDKKALTYVDVHNKQTVERVVIKEEVETILLKEHENHFKQANHTPCCKTDVEEDILKTIRREDHTFQMQHRVDNTTNLLLKQLERKETDPVQISYNISVKNIIKGFKLWKETTSTSPSGRTLPLYKVWIKAKVSDLELSENQFFGMIQKILWIAIETGIPPKRWLTVHNMYIPKDQGSYKVGRLRPLHKIEADLNLLRRELSAKRLLNSAEKQQYISDENYGGRNNRSAIDVVLKKVFTLTTYHLTRTNAAITDCDAKACYDRILPHVMALANIKAGLPKKPATLFMNVLHNMKYHITTGLGISKLANTNSKKTPIYGIGQGATDAPAQWTLMSDIIQKIHNNRAYGTIITNPTKTIKESRSLDMFVDDASMLHTSQNKQASRNELRSIASHDITSWNEGLHSSGGKLCWDKTLCYIIKWMFNEDGTPYIIENREQNDTQVEVLSPEVKKTLPIKEETPTTALRMLGVHIAGNLQNETEYNILYKKAVKFATAIQVCPLTKNQVILAIKTIYKPAIEYVLPATTFSDAQIQAIHRKVIPKMLSSSKLSQKYPRAIVFGPTSLGGLGFPHIAHMQTATKLTHIIKNVRGDTSLGRTFRIMMENAQIQAGIEEQILATTKQIRYIESTWIISLQEKMQAIQAELSIEDYWTPSLKRVNDVMIMDRVQTMNLPNIDVRRINYCRLYLRVTSLSEICSSDGKTIMRKYKTCNQTTSTTMRRQSNLEWPHQNNPNEQSWKLWRMAIRKIVPTYGDRLNTPLGNWITNEDFDKLYDSNNKCALIYDNLQWKKYEVITKGRRFKAFGELQGTGIPNKTHTPITDTTDKGTFTTQNEHQKISKPNKQKTFAEYIAKLSKWQRQLIYKADKRANSDFRKEINLGNTIWLCSDGGVYMNKGYYGWIATTDSKSLTKHKGSVTGNEDTMESHRAEAVGALAALLYIYHFASFHNTRTPTIKHFCDNIAVVNRIKWYQEDQKNKVGRALLPNSDVHMQIEHLLQTSGFEYEIEHVKGHQKQTQSTSYESKLNTEADKLATKAQKLQRQRKSTETHSMYPAATAHLTIQKQLVMKNVYKTVIQTCGTPQLEQHLINRYNWTSQTLNIIWWKPIQATLLSFQPTHHIFSSKIMYQRLPCKGEKFTDYTEDTCPCCNKEKETQLHFEKCTQNKIPHTDLLIKIALTAKKNNIDPNLIKLMQRHFQYKKVDETSLQIDEPNVDWKRYRKVLKAQKEIGWEKLQRGFFATDWDELQWRYERRVEKREAHDPLWLRPILKQIFIHHKKRWKQRNDKEHDKEGVKEKQNLLQRLKWLYEQKKKMHANDRHPFETPVESWNTRPNRSIRNWINQNSTYIRNMVKQQETRDAKSLRDIRNYATVIITTNTKKNGEHNQDEQTKRTHENACYRPKKRQEGLEKYLTSTTTNNETNAGNTSQMQHTLPRSQERRKRKRTAIQVDVEKSKQNDIQTSLAMYFKKPTKESKKKLYQNNELLNPYTLPRPPEEET